MQLASKMRFLSVQFEALLGGDLWLRNARHANAMAQRLAAEVRGLPGLRLTRPVQANAVFAVLDREVTARLQERFHFYVWDEHTGEVRWMTAFDTTEEDIDRFAAAVRAELADAGAGAAVG
jgi:threonine aldolase